MGQGRNQDHVYDHGHTRHSRVSTAALSHIEDHAGKPVKTKEKPNEGFTCLQVFRQSRPGRKIPTDAPYPGLQHSDSYRHLPPREAEEGEYRFTHMVNIPLLTQDLTGLPGKFTHLKEGELSTV